MGEEEHFDLTCRFSRPTYAVLAEIAKARGCEIGELVIEGLTYCNIFYAEKQNGYDEIILRNPKTDQEKVVDLGK